MKIHYNNAECYAQAVRKLGAKFEHGNVNTATVSWLVEKFEESGSENQPVETLMFEQQNIGIQDGGRESPMQSITKAGYVNIFDASNTEKKIFTYFRTRFSWYNQ